MDDDGHMIDGTEEVNDVVDQSPSRRIDELEGLVAELRALVGDEKSLNVQRTTLLAAAAHEFRTPLTAILNSSEFLGMVGRTCPEAKFNEHITKIRRSVRYLTDLSEDLITMMRIDADTSRARHTAIPMREFCEEVIETVGGGSSGESSIILTGDVDGLTVHTDRLLLQHILTNLLDNAMKYSPAGSNVVLQVRVEREYLALSVMDKGRGIRDEDQRTLFDPFARGSNSGDLPGTGLGLSIVKRSVELLGGTVHVESQTGRGSTFKVELPLKHNAAINVVRTPPDA